MTPRSAPTAWHYRWAAFGMAVLTVYGSLLPFQYQPKSWDEAIARFARITEFDPSELEARGDWIVSTVQFAILGFVSMGALCVDRRGIWGWFAAPVVIAAIVALAIGIEFAQVYFPPRTVSINDIQFESLGGCLGTIGWLIAGQRITSWARRIGKVTTLAGFASRLLPGYLAVLLIVQLMPFDFIVRYDELAVKYSEGKVRLNPWPVDAMRPWDMATKSLLNFACFVPLGLLHSLARRHAGAPQHNSDVPWASFAAPILIEFLQFFVYSRTSNTVDVLTGMLGVAAGWRLARLVRPSDASGHSTSTFKMLRPALFLVWLAIVVYLYWRPFDFTVNPERFRADREDWPMYGFRRFTLAPFADYYWNSKYTALDLFVRKAFSFMPLGVLGALSLRDLNRRNAAAGTMFTAFVVAVILEAGRYFLPARSPSSTDVLIACAGAWLGFRVTQHVRLVLWAESALHSWPGVPPSGTRVPPLKWITGP